MRDTLRKFAVLFVLLASVPILACNDDGDDLTIVLDASCSANVGPAGAARVFLDCGQVTGNLATVRILAADVTTEIDGFNIRLTFNPSVFRYIGYVATSHDFAGTCNDGSTTLCDDNLPDANNSGVVVYSIVLIGLDPTGIDASGSTPMLLGELLFEAASASSVAPSFDIPWPTTDCVSNATGTNLLNYNPLSLCPNMEIVETIGGITWENSGLTLTATAP